MRFWNKLFGLGSKTADDYYQRGLARAREGATAEGIAAFTEAIRLDPRHFNAYHDRAVAYVDTADYELSIADLTTAATLDPQMAPVYFNRGFAHAKKGDHREAIEDYTRAISLDPHYAAPLAGRAEALITIDEYSRALDDLAKLLALVTAGTINGPSPVSSPAEILLRRAEVFLRIADYHRAIAECSGALRLKTNLWTALTIFGLACAKKGDYEAGLDHYRKAAGQQSPEWYSNKLRCLEHAIAQHADQLPEQEIVAFGTWVREFDSIAYGNVVEVTEILLEQPTSRELKQARADVIARVRKTPAEFIPLALYRLACALFTDGDREEAVFWLNAARLRTWYDACRCADLVARNTTLRDLEAQMPDALLKADQNDQQLHARVIQNVLDWDEETAYRYDHRWIYQHGSGAYIAFMGPEQAAAAGLEESRDPDAEPGTLSLPEKRWPELRQLAREHFRTGLDERLQRPANVEIAKGTLCGPQLQKDVLENLRMVESRGDGDLGRVLSAKVVKVSNETTYFGIGMVKGSWTERWDVERAGTTVVYEIQFQADGQGGTYFGVRSAGE